MSRESCEAVERREVYYRGMVQGVGFRYTVRRLLAPIEQTAALCGLRYLAPFVVHGTHALDATTTEEHRSDYHRLLEALRDDRVDLEAAAEAHRINANIDAIVRTPTP